jgi:hypothetical protein
MGCRCLVSLSLALAACAAPPPEEADLEFLHEPVTSLKEDPSGGAWIGLGPWSRQFRIDRKESPGWAQMLEFAIAAKASGAPVHATLWVRDRISKASLLSGGTVGSQPIVVLWLSDAPDPRARR